jgi:O-antigen/teichoic acid export membrane protein
VNERLVERAGTAMVWKALQLAGVKAIFLARTLILARLLVPEDFGLLAVSLIAVDFLASITNFGMIPALVQRAEPEERHYHAAWTIGLLRAVIIALVVILGAPVIATFLSEPRAIGLIQVIALRPLVEAAGSPRVADIMRQLRFRSMAIMSVPEALASATVSIALAQPLGVWALVLGALVGPTVSSLISFRVAPYHPRLTLEPAAVRTLLHFGRWIFFTSLISVAGRAILQIVITRKLGVEALGLYYLAAKLAFIPYEVSSEVVGAVAFPLFARLQADAAQVIRAFRALFTSVAALLFPTSALLVVLAPSLVIYVLGPRWQGTVLLIQLLALVSIVGLFGDTVGPILKGLGQPSRLAVLELIQSITLILVIWSLADSNGIVSAAIAWLAAVSASQLVSALFLQLALPKSLNGLARPTLAIVMAAGLGAWIAFFVIKALPGPFGLIVASGLGTVSALSLLWIMDRWLTFGLASGFYRIFPQLAAWVDYSPLDVR